MSIQFVQCADLHLDRNFGISNFTRAQQRKHDLNANFSSIVQYALDNHADLFLICGDIFDRYLPSSSSQVFFASQIKKLNEADIKVFMIGGNHDVPRIPNQPVLAIDLLDTTGLAKVFSKPDVLQHMTIEVNGKSVSIYGKSYYQQSDLKNPLSGINRLNTDGYNIVMIHGSLLGLGISPPSPEMAGHNPFYSNDVSNDIDYLALGHFHNHFEVNTNNTKICNPGSIEKLTWGEMNDKKGFIWAEASGSGTTTEFINLPCRQMQKEQIILSTEDSEPDSKIKNSIARFSDQEKIFKASIQGSVTIEQYNRLRVEELCNFFRESFFDFVIDREDLEILWIFPTANAFTRQDKIGAIPLAKKAAQERNVKIRILVPVNSSIEQKIQKLKENCPDSVIDVRYIEQMTETKATILVVDRKASLVMELRDDLKSTFAEAIGLSTYSNSKAGVLSYVAIFENLWVQSDLYEQLKINDKMQKEFINIAAHELRTPVQPILSLSEILQSDISNNAKQQEFLDAIVRNAKRLQRLTENILDITRIEGHSLELRKERFSLNENIRNVINDMNNRAVLRNNNNKTVSILFETEQDIIVEADKVRIYGVILNLLKNAIHFTNEGTIHIAAAEKMDYNEVIVSVKDTGEGIDPEIFPRLFTKFTTSSVTGTGLGLFISKSIVEAHGGKIWAQNNSDGIGATFYFSLPLSK
jgi:signal transduction histidine kinase/DNA repair exonuclease SbcCD nuclease subunit